MVLVAALCLFSQAASPVKLDVQIRPFANLYFIVLRSLGKGPVSVSEMKHPPLERRLDLLLSVIDATAVECDSPEAFLEACKKLPEKIERGGESLAGREVGVRWAKLLVDIPEADRKQIYKYCTEELAPMKKKVDDAFAAHPGLIQAALESLAMQTRPLTIPVVVSPFVPGPGAVTYRKSATEAVCVIGKGPEGTQLIETVLHEVIHAVDFSNQREPSALLDLRTALSKGGADPKVAAECVHAVIFAQAAATVRKVVDSKHVPVGEKKGGAYERMGKPAKEAVAIWTDRCSGKLDVKAAVEKIVEAAKAGAKPIARR